MLSTLIFHQHDADAMAKIILARATHHSQQELNIRYVVVLEFDWASSLDTILLLRSPPWFLDFVHSLWCTERRGTEERQARYFLEFWRARR